MASFKDANGKSWVLALDAPTIRRVRSELGLNLIGVDGSAFEQLVDDPALLVDVLYVLCHEQAGLANITDVQFGKALVGEVIDKATAALLEAITDFFPPSKRALLKAVTEKTAALRETGMQRALEKINDPVLTARIMADLDAQMDAQIQQSLTRLSSATASPASAE